jgi:hypothetical protein
MDASRPEWEPLVVFKIVVLMKLLRFLAAILSFGVLHTNPSWRTADLVVNHSPRSFGVLHTNPSRRTAELVVNHSPRSIDTLCCVSRRTANPEERKIGEPRTQLSQVWYGTHQYLK